MWIPFNPFCKLANKLILLRLGGVTSAGAAVGAAVVPVSTLLLIAEPLEVTEGLINEAIENSEGLSLVGSGNTVSGCGVDLK